MSEGEKDREMEKLENWDIDEKQALVKEWALEYCMQELNYK